MEVTQDAQDEYNEQLQQELRGYAWSTGCSNWYLNAQGVNVTTWPGTTLEYERRTAAASLDDIRFAP